jgi:mRNA interferase YafQ
MMKRLNIILSTVMKRDLKRVAKRGKPLEALYQVVTLLSEKQPLPIRYRDHALTGNWIGHRDCHIQPDWVLIYQIDDDDLSLERTGTHSDLFG